MTARNISVTLASLIAITLSTAQFARSESGIRQTLKDLDHQAQVVAEDADELSQLSWDTLNGPDAHLARLNAVKAEVNRMADEVNRLQAERTALAPWERGTLDMTLPLVNDAALQAGKAIRYFDANRSLLWTGKYREYTNDIHKDSQQIARTLGTYLKYERVSDEARHMKHMLGTPTD
ncbi:MAG: hypothetical protein ABI822_32700 [Bryobacteraceae bacterium]